MNMFLRKIPLATILVLLGLAIVILDVAKPHVVPALRSKDDGLSWIEGKWQATEIHSDVNGPYIIRKTIEFIDPKLIIYNQYLIRNGTIQTINYYNLLFHYQLVGEDQLDLSARVSDRWKIDRNGQKLIISESSFVGKGEGNPPVK